MGCKIILWVSLGIFLGIFIAAEAHRSPCNFNAIYNFGDSNSDTSVLDTNANGTQTLNPYKPLPGKPLRKFTDGRCIIDYIAEKLGKSYLSSYFDKFGTNFKSGANFAIGGATIDIRPDVYGVNFPNETAGFNRYRAKAIKAGTATPVDFSKALYTIDFGQNDVTRSMYGANVKEIPNVIAVFTAQFQGLYNQGARTFWIHNTGPVGCLVAFQMSRSFWMSGTLDNAGCLVSYNDVAKEFNRQLKSKVVELRAEFNDVAITLVDIYTAKYNLFSNGKKLGFPDPLGTCRNATTICADPSKFVLWDGIHYTEAANRLVAQAILGGKLSDPPIAVTQACYKN